MGIKVEKGAATSYEGWQCKPSPTGAHHWEWVPEHGRWVCRHCKESVADFRWQTRNIKNKRPYRNYKIVLEGQNRPE